MKRDPLRSLRAQIAMKNALIQERHRRDVECAAAALPLLKELLKLKIHEATTRRKRHG